MLNLAEFISKYVTKRPKSMFQDDINDYKDQIEAEIAGKSVLVIGGAGSIGSSFIKAILPFRPAELYIVDTNENALTELTRDLRSSDSFVPAVYIPYPMDYSSATFNHFFSRRHSFEIIANFSAHKHVRSEKDICSVEALLRNNVINARVLMEQLALCPPHSYFCVSTDKAVNPVNIMGASKRIMEDLIFSYSKDFPVKTARFANVAFSNGSLPAGFLERLSKLQPLSAPSDIKRYFVSPEESGQICMLSAILGGNREIFFPKLDEEQMMTFDTIAVKLLKIYGYEALNCKSDEEAIARAVALKRGERMYPVHFSVSDTSGEKAFEEFYTSSETVEERRFRALGVITNKPAPDKKVIHELIDTLDRIFEKPSVTKDEVVRILSDYLPDFRHAETGKSLDEKM